ncbi:MAG: RusA family crossover junction endodeoxyribonuclease [Leptolyngbyaceae cyanobacterium SL_5_14]|nr:RusA family crossover junction endodeoxyribonuclease [Leptolyngbyaceae cyanobacterium SL_5_14]NJO66140.1 RusA family crossover junction endodeoxyribonuclease [Leptolyngbyaceae cyanobacterium RM1_405_57]
MSRTPNPYRRRRGDRVFYTPQQTAHYKSEHLRWQTGRRLRPSGMVVVSPDVVKYRFPSVRSPSGVWEVTVTRGDATPGDGGGSGDGCWNPAVPAAGAGASISLQRYTGWRGPRSSPGDGDFTNRDGNGNPIFTNGAPPPNLGGVVEDFEDRFSYLPWHVSSNYLLANDSGSSDDWQDWYYWELWTTSYPYPNFPALPPEFSEHGNNPLAAITSHTSGGNSYRSSCPYPPGSGGGGTSGEYITYDCNCPDHDKRQGALIQSRYSSEHENRDWSSSNAGARENCKHIYGTMFARGENPPDPSDRQPDQRAPQRGRNPSDYYDQEEDFLRGLVEGRRQQVSEEVQNYYSDLAHRTRARVNRRQRREWLQQSVDQRGTTNRDVLARRQNEYAMERSADREFEREFLSPEFENEIDANGQDNVSGSY